MQRRLTAEERMEVARGSLESGDAATAMIHLRNVLQADPSNVEARVLLAEAAFKSGDFDSAAKEYLRAIDLGADAGRIPGAPGRVAGARGRPGRGAALHRSREAGDDARLRFWRAPGAGTQSGEPRKRVPAREAARRAGPGRPCEVALARLALAAQRTRRKPWPCSTRWPTPWPATSITGR
jgi:cellulose synthase operon protein C